MLWVEKRGKKRERGVGGWVGGGSKQTIVYVPPSPPTTPRFRPPRPSAAAAAAACAISICVCVVLWCVGGWVGGMRRSWPLWEGQGRREKMCLLFGAHAKGFGRCRGVVAWA